MAGAPTARTLEDGAGKCKIVSDETRFDVFIMAAVRASRVALV